MGAPWCGAALRRAAGGTGHRQPALLRDRTPPDAAAAVRGVGARRRHRPRLQTKPARPRLLQCQPCGLALLSNAAVAWHARAARDRLDRRLRSHLGRLRRARRAAAAVRGKRSSGRRPRCCATRALRSRGSPRTACSRSRARARRWCAAGTWPPSGARGSSSFASTTARASPRSAHARSRRWSSPAAPTARSRRSTPARLPQRQRFCALRARPAPRLPR